MSNKLLVVIAGSTGVGKTEVAIKLAQKYQTEILSADSRQVYKELNIGVGRPSQTHLESIKHHFIGHISIHQPYTAAMFATEAMAVLDGLFQSNDIVIMAGGTGLYIKALVSGFDDIPEVPKAIFNKWQTQWEAEGTGSLLSSLRKLDPVYYKTVDQSNHTRLIRALSVIESSGVPFSSFLRGRKAILPFDVLPIALTLPREELYARIDQRVVRMLESGWLEEAKNLYAYKSLQALQTVGYNELFEYFDGELSFEKAITTIQQSTRRYAKRQMTWWRNQGDWLQKHPADLDNIIDAIDQQLGSSGGSRH